MPTATSKYRHCERERLRELKVARIVYKYGIYEVIRWLIFNVRTANERTVALLIYCGYEENVYFDNGDLEEMFDKKDAAAVRKAKGRLLDRLIAEFGARG